MISDQTTVTSACCWCQFFTAGFKKGHHIKNVKAFKYAGNLNFTISNHGDLKTAVCLSNNINNWKKRLQGYFKSNSFVSLQCNSESSLNGPSLSPLNQEHFMKSAPRTAGNIWHNKWQNKKLPSRKKSQTSQKNGKKTVCSQLAQKYLSNTWYST